MIGTAMHTARGKNVVMNRINTVKKKRASRKMVSSPTGKQTAPAKKTYCKHLRYLIMDGKKYGYTPNNTQGCNDVHNLDVLMSIPHNDQHH